MHSLRSCILLAAVAHGATIQERAIVPFRAPKVPERPGFSSGEFGGVRPHIGSGASDAGAWAGIAAGGRGTAPESTTPFQPGFYERNKELIEKAVEAIEQVYDVLSNVIDLAGGNDDDDDDTEKWQATKTLPSSIKPTQVASTSDGATNSTANYIISQNNVTYTFFSDPRLMSKDVAAEMADPSFPRLRSYQDLLTNQEYTMFLNDPICFYANIESMYLNASASASAEPEASITPSPTQSLQRRQSTDDENTSCEDLGIAGFSAECTAVPGSPQWTSSQASSISYLWASQMPDLLWSAHFATPTAVSGEVTATATSTTSCAALDGREGVVTKYRELQIKAEESSGSDGAATTPANESVSAGVRIGGLSMLAGTVGAAAAVIAKLVL
jgi:hypothetical protein